MDAHDPQIKVLYDLVMQLVDANGYEAEENQMPKELKEKLIKQL